MLKNYTQFINENNSNNFISESLKKVLLEIDCYISNEILNLKSSKFNHIDIDESKDYEETSWTKTIDGEEVTITIKDIEKLLKDKPVFEIEVGKISNLCIHKDKTDKKTIKRSQESDLKYPIIISKNLNGEFNMVLDGNHRLKKAIDNNNKHIKSKILNLKESPVIFQKMFS